MSYIFNGGTGGGSGTVTNTGGALTLNSVVLGAGGNDTKVVTAFTTNGTSTLTVGVAAGGNGVLALAGNTSGTATITAPAVAGTNTNPIAFSNVITVPDGISTGFAGASAPTSALSWSSGQLIYRSGGTATVGFTANLMGVINTTPIAWSSTSNAPTTTVDSGLSRFAVGVVAVGTGANASKAGLIQSGMSQFVTANFTTSGVGTALEAITGLSITVPATAANWTFHAHLAYSQAVGTAAVAFGIQAVTNAPTNIFATGELFTAAGTVVTGVLPTLTTTTATSIVSGTPGGTGTNLAVDLYGTCELGATANTIRILVSTATAADLVTILRGSYFTFNC